MDLLLELLPLPEDIVAIIASYNIQKIPITDVRYSILDKHSHIASSKHPFFFAENGLTGELVQFTDDYHKFLRYNIGDFLTVFTFQNSRDKTNCTYFEHHSHAM